MRAVVASVSSLHFVLGEHGQSVGSGIDHGDDAVLGKK